MAESEDTTVPTVEEWRRVVGFPDYSVSNLGRVRRDVTRHRSMAGRILAYRLGQGGYVVTGLCRDGNVFGLRVHRLVALAFIGEPPKGKPNVNHLNGIKTDNRVENLEWASPADDGAHRVRMGLTASGDRNGSRLHPERVARGDRNGARLHPERVARGDRNGARLYPERLVRGDDHPSRTRPERRPRGESHARAKLTERQVRDIRSRHATGETRISLAREFKINPSGVSKIVARETWRHVT